MRLKRVAMLVGGWLCIVLGAFQLLGILVEWLSPAYASVRESFTIGAYVTVAALGSALLGIGVLLLYGAPRKDPAHLYTFNQEASWVTSTGKPPLWEAIIMFSVGTLCLAGGITIWLTYSFHCADGYCLFDPFGMPYPVLSIENFVQLASLGTGVTLVAKALGKKLT